MGVSEIRPGRSPRFTEIDTDYARALVEVFDDLPPILVHAETRTVVDGAHRLWAAKALGRHHVDVELFSGTASEAFVEAVTSNVRHGKPLTLDERKAAACEVLRAHPDWSNRRVALACALSDKTVDDLRRTLGNDAGETGSRLGRDGRHRPLNPVARRAKAAELLTEAPSRSLRDVARQVQLSPATVLDVRRRLAHGRPVAGPDRGERGTTRTPERRPVNGTDDVAPPSAIQALIDLRQSLRWLADPFILDDVEQREFATWFRAHLNDNSSFVRFHDAVPVNDRLTVAKLARVQGNMWLRFADELDAQATKRAL